MCICSVTFGYAGFSLEKNERRNGSGTVRHGIGGSVNNRTPWNRAGTARFETACWNSSTEYWFAV